MSVPIRQRVLGKPREQVAAICRQLHHDEMVDLVHDLATLEPHVTAKDIAHSRRMGQAKVERLLRAGVFGPLVHKTGRTNPYTVPISAVRRYDELTAIPTTNGAG